MNSTELHTLTGAYALNALSGPERAEFEEHLGQCEACRVEVDELRETAATLAEDVAVTPPASLRSSVLAEIQRVRQSPPETDGGQERSEVVPLRPRRRLTTVAILTAAASVVAAAGLGVYAFQSSQRLDNANERLDAEAKSRADLLAVLTAPDARLLVNDKPGLHATVVVAESQDKLAFLPGDMSTPGAGRTYQLWLIGPAGAQSAGLLAGTPLVTDSVRRAEQVGVTVEPEGGSKQPTSDPVLLLTLT